MNNTHTKKITHQRKQSKAQSDFRYLYNHSFIPHSTDINHQHCSRGKDVTVNKTDKHSCPYEASLSWEKTDNKIIIIKIINNKITNTNIVY